MTLDPLRNAFKATLKGIINDTFKAIYTISKFTFYYYSMIIDI